MKFYSARQAIHDAYALAFLSQGFDVKKFLTMDFKSTKGAKDLNWRHVDQAEAGLILHSLSKLQPHQRDWSVWCYAPRIPEYLPEQGRLFEWINNDVAIRLLESERTYRPATADKIRDVVAYTVLDYRHFVTTEQHLHTDRDIRKRCGIMRQNWQRDFSHGSRHTFKPVIS